MIDFFTNPDFFVIRVSTRKECKEIELLLLARSVPFTLQNEYWQKLFYIPVRFEGLAKTEVQAFFEENENWPPIQEKSNHYTFRFSFLTVWIGVCLAFFHWNVTRIDTFTKWYELGKFTADGVLEGDWWRIFTAMTLHVDDAHLLSNLAGLIVFVSGVNYFVGPGFSWFLILLSSALGNYFNALFYQTGHPSVGASTAVFSAVGLMGVFGIRNYYHQRQFKGRYFVPFLAGFGIFAMLGTSPQTDVTAHLFGFFAGSLLGLIVLPFIGSKLIINRSSQVLFFLLFCLLLYFAWYLPIHSG
ncbi:rhomboid family intramembrane serine protease [bacterium]|nr:rhomboid family intramembrane serine protease [bacterium]